MTRLFQHDTYALDGPLTAGFSLKNRRGERVASGLAPFRSHMSGTALAAGFSRHSTPELVIRTIWATYFQSGDKKQKSPAVCRATGQMEITSNHKLRAKIQKIPPTGIEPVLPD
jgi:hypothetical protein